MERLTNKPENSDGYSLICSDTCQNGYNCSFCEHDSEALDKLGAYEDAEEQGLLVRLPCKVGTPAYFIKKTGFHPELIETRIDEIGVRRGGMFVKLSCNSMYRTAISAWGKTVFLTREEAETALAEIEREDRT